MKFVVSGAHHSGKTSLLKFLDPKVLSVDEQTPSHEMTTVAMDVGKHIIDDFILTLFGTPGFERFEMIRKIIMKGTDVIIFLFDGTNTQQDDNAFKILNEIQSTLDPEKPKFRIVFAVNKCDLEMHRTAGDIHQLIVKALPKNVFEAFSRITVMENPTKIKIFEISAKSGQNVVSLMNAALSLTKQKWKPVLEQIRKSNKNIVTLGTELNLNQEQMKDLMNEVEMRKLVIINRATKTVEFTSLGLKIL